MSRKKRADEATSSLSHTLMLTSIDMLVLEVESLPNKPRNERAKAWAENLKHAADLYARDLYGKHY